jgi:hypothetical protein
MPRFELPKGVRDVRSILNEYRPKKWRENQVDSEVSPQSTYDDVANSIDQGPTGFPDTVAGLDWRIVTAVEGDNVDRGRNNEPGHSRLDEIAEALRTLTYGQMLELAESMWKVNSQGSGITESDLPNVLHRWSKSRGTEN